MASLGSDIPVPSSHSLAMQVAYSAANLGKSVVWTSFDSIMLFYLVSIAGFGPLSAAALLAAALTWDALFDLQVARWADRRGDRNSLARLVLFGAPLCGIGFWCIFLFQAPGAIATAIIACRVGYSLCDVGHNTLLIRVARAPGDAARVSGLRLLFSAGGVALLALVSGASLSLAAPEAQRHAFASGAVVGALLYVGTLFGAMLATRDLAPPSVGTGGPRAIVPLRSYWRNAPFRRLLCVIAVQAALVPLFQRALPFFGQAVLADASWAGPALLTVTIAQSLALPGWMMLARRWTSRRIAMTAYGMTILAMVGMTVMPIGLWGTGMLTLLGVSMGGMNLAIWALLTETVQQSMAAGTQEEGTPVGLFLAVLKGAAAAGNLLFGAIVAAGTVRLPGRNGIEVELVPLSATILPVLGSVLALALLAMGSRRAPPA